MTARWHGPARIYVGPGGFEIEPSDDPDFSAVIYVPTDARIHLGGPVKTPPPERKPPVWLPGDMVILVFNRGYGCHPRLYTRQEDDRWVGHANAHPILSDLTDADMDSYYRDNKLRLGLQAGGVPFDRTRLE